MPTIHTPSSLLTDTTYGVVPSVRDPQIALASHVARALADGTGLAAEAGTGVGKTLAYAGQAVEMLLNTDAAPVVIIATATKALQAQLIEHELPRLAAGVVARMKRDGASDEDVSRALKKIRFAKKVGKKNHLCLRRVEQMAPRSPDVAKFLPVYRDFTDYVPGWVIADADDDKPLPEDAGRFGVGYCNPDRCKYSDACSKNGYLAAKSAAEEAKILVTNHALVAADLVLRQREVRSVLPNNVSAFVIDEAHKFPDTLREALTVTFSAGIWVKAAQSYAQLRFELDNDARTFPPYLPGSGGVRGTCDTFLRDVSEESTPTANAYARALTDALSDVMRTTQCSDLSGLRKRASSTSESTPYGAFLREMSSYAAALNLHYNALSMLCDEVQMKGRYILSSEPAQTVGEPPTRSLVPIALGGSWGPYLTGVGACPIYVSATLAAGTGTGAQAFAPFLGEVGRQHNHKPVDTYMAGSPFDYGAQAVLYTPKGVSHEGVDLATYAAELVTVTRPLLLANEGHAFVLFTSAAALIAYETALGESGYPYPILSQCSSDQVKTRGTSLFKRTPNATLLGLRTFFEGVDVPGLNLSLVIIPKLPFSPPTAAIRAKRARFEDGYSGFQSVDIPVMLTDLRQMAGRLIRSTSDRGVVALLDPRITTKEYGPDVVDALGFPTRRKQEAAVVEYLRLISARRAQAEPPRVAYSDAFAAALSGGC